MSSVGMGENHTASYAVPPFKPRREVYDSWRRWENLPQFARHLKSVEDLVNNRTRWTAEGPREDVTWEAETIGALSLELLKDWGRTEPGPVTDAMIIGADQKGEHLEMAWNGLMRSFYQQLGDQEAVALLEQSLEEEKRAGQLLTRIAEAGVNQTAANVR